jgi:hypothetical protein
VITGAGWRGVPLDSKVRRVAEEHVDRHWRCARTSTGCGLRNCVHKGAWDVDKVCLGSSYAKMEWGARQLKGILARIWGNVKGKINASYHTSYYI